MTVFFSVFGDNLVFTSGVGARYATRSRWFFVFSVTGRLLTNPVETLVSFAILLLVPQHENLVISVSERYRECQHVRA